MDFSYAANPEIDGGYEHKGPPDRCHFLADNGKHEIAWRPSNLAEQH